MRRFSFGTSMGRMFSGMSKRKLSFVGWSLLDTSHGMLDIDTLQHASHRIKHQSKDKQGLLILTPEDILPIEIPHQRTKIGF